ncbi:MAG: hypothetical protein HY013_05375 [Candidatus Solibacter usitatus]|nr:hypothetical protein [Candidatus Solibacter usitatus]
MKHPEERILALQAGGDLGFWTAFRVRLHVRGCEECRGRLAEFSKVRRALAGWDEVTVPEWERLAAEMKANVRLGLEAGECVAHPELILQEPPLSAAHTLLAYASVLLLVAAGVWLQRPGPDYGTEAQVLAATPSGIEWKQGGQTLGLLHDAARAGEVTVSVGAQGAMDARYVDSHTGYVTIHHVVSVQ